MSPTVKKPVNYASSNEVAWQVALEDSVLLRNHRDALPLPATAKQALVTGDYADGRVFSGSRSA
jgi:beta-glucosidase